MRLTAYFLYLLVFLFPEPHADRVRSSAKKINEYFRPKALIKDPEMIAPKRQPHKALPTAHLFAAALHSKYLLQKIGYR